MTTVFQTLNGKLYDVCEIASLYQLDRGPCSSVGIATEYGLDGPGSNPGGAVQTGPGTHPASCKMGTGSFPGV